MLLYGVVLLWAGVALATPPQTRVVNGVSSDIVKYPYMVSIRIAGSHTCGGVGISSTWVLTAAHCIKPQYAVAHYTVQHSTTRLYAGSANVIQVNQYISHAAYNSSNLYINDIGLMRLAKPMTLVQYASLPGQKSEPRYGLTGTLLGWGRKTTDGPIEPQLQEAAVELFVAKECQLRLGITLHLSHICSGKPDEQRGQCTGDSGGPLISDGYHVGIVSFSHKPCANWPGVFTKVSHYRDWIRSVSGV